MGYLGGGLLLAINIVMIQIWPAWGPRLSFLSVGLWWAIFSIPIFTRIPEPPAATASLAPGESVVGVSFKRLWETIKDISRYKELFKYLLAFLIYIDGIGTIIGVAAIYGAELGFGSIELILALLLVQFVGIPFSLIFGRLPSKNETRRPFFLAFVLFNLIALPLTGLVSSAFLPSNVTGTPPDPYMTVGEYAGEGVYQAAGDQFSVDGSWEPVVISADILGTENDLAYMTSVSQGDRLAFPFNGKRVDLTYSAGPDHGIFNVEIDGQIAMDPSSGEPYVIDAYQPTDSLWTHRGNRCRGTRSARAHSSQYG
ncbi:MAG: hypothetical protein GWN30_32580, partial [Gammaproteobacteria bacterium]|nr:hypothetical protein [Gammaproteobacteria bacterium]